MSAACSWPFAPYPENTHSGSGMSAGACVGRPPCATSHIDIEACLESRVRAQEAPHADIGR